MNFASLNCKATLEGGEEPVHTLARPQLSPSVPRAQTLTLIRASQGLDVLSGNSTLTSTQALTSVLCLVGLGFFGFGFVLIPTLNSATTQLDKERRLSMGFTLLHSILCRQAWKPPPLRFSFCFLKNVPLSRFFCPCLRGFLCTCLETPWPSGERLRDHIRADTPLSPDSAPSYH